jgi:hypothetical protein
MNIQSQALTKPESPFAPALGISGVIFALLGFALLRVLGVPLFPVILILLAGVLAWGALRHTLLALGAVLAFMPIYPVAMLLGRFFGPAFMMSDAAKAADRLVMLLLVCILCWRNGVKLKTPDWLLLGCFALAAIRWVFGGEFIALVGDFNLMIAYAAGRVTFLSLSQEKLWARYAVGLVAVLSLLGLAEVFIFGEVPRTVLYLAVGNRVTDNGALNPTFHAEGFTGLRESATMIGPLQFASLCMVALLIWWVYQHNLWTGALIAAGLVCSLTRSAWLGTAVAIPFLAFVMGQKKRFLIYAGIGVALFIVSIPLLGLSDFIFAAKKAEDASSQGHAESIVKGLEYAAGHPWGAGPGNAGFYATTNNSVGVFIEDSYLTLSAEYGIAVSLCFLAFLVSAIWFTVRQKTPLGYLAAGIVLGFAVVLIFAPLHLDFNLACWVWFPVGLAIRAATAK